jgi:2,3-bisphosphoglycerate-independent phosphoglycerate mutase
VTDRRAGRIDTAVCEELCTLLSKKVRKLGETEVIIKAGKGHRFVVIFRGKGLEGPLTDADPHREGSPIPPVRPVNRHRRRRRRRRNWWRIFTKRRCL